MEQTLANAAAADTQRRVREQLSTTRDPRGSRRDPTDPQWDAMDHLIALEEQKQNPPAKPGRKLPTPPAWWKGDEDATRSSMIAAQQLRPRR